MNGQTLAETAACLNLDAEDVARLALWFTTGRDEAEHAHNALALLSEARRNARPTLHAPIDAALVQVKRGI